MELDEVLTLLRQTAAVRAGSSRADVLAALAAVRRVRAFVEGEEVRLAGLVESVAACPEDAVATAGRGSLRDAAKVVQRAHTVADFPDLAEGMAAGAVSGEHVDVVTRAARQLEPAQRAVLLAQSAEVAAAAAVLTPEQLARDLRRRTRGLVDREARLVEQQRKVSLTWRVRDDGMHQWTLLLDPASAPAFAQRIAAATEALFHDRTPANCPSDPLARQTFLRAHALLCAVEGKGMRLGRPEVVVVVDTRVADPEGGPVIDWGIPVEVPPRVLLDLVGRADVHTVVVRNGVVLHAEGELRLGRSTRMANRAQRRALRALYATCAIPGCAARFDQCSIHHVVWWRHHGRTDLENLLPLCSRHHHCVHDDGWALHLADDRTLTIRLPDGTVRITGPPSRSAA